MNRLWRLYLFARYSLPSVGWVGFLIAYEAIAGTLLLAAFMGTVYTAIAFPSPPPLLSSQGQASQAIQDLRIQTNEERITELEKSMRREEDKRIEDRLDTTRILVNHEDRMAQIEQLLRWLVWLVGMSVVSVIGMVAHTIYSVVIEKKQRKGQA